MSMEMLYWIIFYNNDVVYYPEANAVAHKGKSHTYYGKYKM